MKPARKGTAANHLPSVDIRVEAGDWPPAAKLRALVEPTVAAAIATGVRPIAEGSELSLVFTDDTHVRALNRRYRGTDSATDVLSFPGTRTNAKAFGPLLGDIVFAAETIAREASAGKIPADHHLAHLVLHGFLHLLGYDHAESDEAVVMERLETAILARLGIADPYDAGPDDRG